MTNNNQSLAMSLHRTRQLMRDTHKLCVHTEQDNMNARNQWETLAAFDTAQDRNTTRHSDKDRRLQECQGSFTKPRNTLVQGDRTLTVCRRKKEFLKSGVDFTYIYIYKKISWREIIGCNVQYTHCRACIIYKAGTFSQMRQGSFS